MPARIQQRRTKGWRKPPNVVAVGRGTMWGNPWRVGIDGTAEEVVAYFREWLDGQRSAPSHWRFSAQRVRAALPKLCGRDLMCWCHADELCHADVLIELANGSR